MPFTTIPHFLIFLHAGLGGIALLTGGISLAVTKGGRLHKQSGKVFYYAMLASALAALVIAVLPGHLSPFLFSIALFTIYFIVSGYRSIGYKRPGFDLRPDKVIAGLVILTGLGMICYPVVVSGNFNVILLVFGSVALTFGIRDLRVYRDPIKARKNWLKLHLQKMAGGYIAAITAFFVVNGILPGKLNWFLPGVVGTVYIVYWIARVNRGGSSTKLGKTDLP